MSVVELGYFLHPCEDDLVVKCTNEKIPYFNAPLYFENKQQIGKVDEIFGPINDFVSFVRLVNAFLYECYILLYCGTMCILQYVLPVFMKSLFHGTGSVPMDVGHLPLLARLSGTLCPRTCGTRIFLRTVTGSQLKTFLFSQY